VKGRFEVRERELEMEFHVPIGALKFSYEDHVDASSVQQTLATLDSFKMSELVQLRRDLVREARHLV
jgi:hypothetical protein